jgi:alpha-glucosidase
MSNSPILHAAIKDAEWWRTAVIYQIYPRSFADGNGDGMGDLPGVTSRLHKLAELGVDAIWFSPFFKSPQKGAGYDVSDYRQIDPLFGTNEDLENLVKRADELGLRIIVDLVPNHTSDQHAWFQAALAAAPGSPARDMYIFKDGKGQNGELPPNNWQSIFGGAAWTRIQDENGNPGQWYLHLFDSTQPDLNWENPQVAEEFDNILRFWLDRGVAGFRIDVAHGMVKRHGLPDAKEFNEDGSPTPTAGLSQAELEERVPYWGQPAIHDFIRRFRKVVDEYDDRAMCAEASMSPLDRLKLWVRPDEYHQTFNFDYLETPWNPERLKAIVSDSLKAFGSVGAASTWVLSNHDQVRHATRYGYDHGKVPKQGDGIGPDYLQPDEAKGLRTARAATSFMLGLPGSAYLYQGEELGLPEHTTLPAEYRQDPTFFRTNGERVGRDGCRVPLPWEADATASNGFNSTGKSWLPQPASYRVFARNLQEGIAGSTLELYKRLLKERKAFGMGSGEFRWAEEYQDANTLAYINNGVLVLSNFGPDPVVLPAGEVLVTTQHDLTVERELEYDQTVWIKL